MFIVARCWALLDHKYTIYVFSEGVIRTSSEPYDATDLKNITSHLTNHCIQVHMCNMNYVMKTDLTFLNIDIIRATVYVSFSFCLSIIFVMVEFPHAGRGLYATLLLTLYVMVIYFSCYVLFGYVVMCMPYATVACSTCSLYVHLPSSLLVTAVFLLGDW